MGNILWSKSSASVKDDKTRGVKRKTCPDSLTPIKRKRLSQSDDPTTERRGVKRKATEDGEGEPTKKKEKKGRLAFNLFGFNLFGFNLFGKESASSSKDSGKAAADDKGPNTKKKRRPDLKKARQSAFLRAEFEAKYKQQDQLGEGGCGTVFGGYRKADNLPVAIKHIPEENILYQHVNGTRKQLCVEVAIMLKLADKRSPPVGMSASVSLLDWYNLDQELILVMERPIPAEDLHHYIDNNGGSLPEQEAKIILKQLVDAAIDLEKKKIFHRDIKSENILIETSSDVPRVRLIDFGLSCFVKRGACYRIFCGTYNFISPELFSHGWYRAGPTTVWQMGVVLFETLHDADFETIKFLEKRLRINETLSKNCQDFLQRCLTRDPKQRPTLEQLRLHPKGNVRNSFIVILQDKVKLQKSSLKENVRNSFIVILQDEVMLQKNSLKENVRNSFIVILQDEVMLQKNSLKENVRNSCF